jgi:hypothetical protein
VIGSDVRIVNISSEIFIYTMAPKGDLLDLIGPTSEIGNWRVMTNPISPIYMLRYSNHLCPCDTVSSLPYVHSRNIVSSLAACVKHGAALGG